MSKTTQYIQTFSWRYLLPKYWTTWFGLFFLWLFSYLPFTLKRRFSRIIAKNIYKKNAKRRNIVETNLSMAFTQLSNVELQNMALDFFTNAVFIFLDYPLLFWARQKTLKKRIKFTGAEHIEKCYQENKPVILLTCHMLALEYGALVLTERFKAVGLIKPAKNHLFEWFITRGRNRYQGMVELYLREKGIRPVVRAIKKLRTFYYLPDEDLGEKAKMAFVPFFGVETATLTALSPMSKMTKAAVLPAITTLNEKTGCYTLEVGKALANFPSNDEQDDMERMNQVLERLILKAPTQYMWSLRMFHTRPNDPSSPYNG